MNKTIKVTEFFNIGEPIEVNLVREFRVLKKFPRKWEVLFYCKTEHTEHESGITTICCSKDTKKYYFIRYFDNSFNEMYAEVSGVDWGRLFDMLYNLPKYTDETKALILAEVNHSS